MIAAPIIMTADAGKAIHVVTAPALRSFWSHDLRWWRDLANGGMVWFLIFAAVSAAGVVICTKLALDWTGEIERHDNAETEAYKVGVDGRVADASTAGIAAGRDAADALAKLKGAEAKIAIASASAEKARADLARSMATIETTKAQAAEAYARASASELALAQYRVGRSLSAAQRAILLELLKISPKSRVVVKPNLLNSEATRFANELSAVFNAAGFIGVGDAPLNIVSYNQPGLFLAVKDASRPPLSNNSILEAFKMAGVSIESEHGDWVPDDNTVVILVSENP